MEGSDDSSSYREDYDEVDEESSVFSADLSSEDASDSMEEEGSSSDMEMIELNRMDVEEIDEDEGNRLVNLSLLAKLHQHPEIPFKVLFKFINCS